MNVVPWPSALDTLMAPRCPRTIPSTAASPSPRPVNFVVKNGSKMREAVAASIPWPVSETRTSTYSPSGRSGERYMPAKVRRVAWTMPVFTETTPPPSSIASEALMTRFMTTCRICVASPSTNAPPAAKSYSSFTPWPSETRSRSEISRTSPSTSNRPRMNVPLPE